MQHSLRVLQPLWFFLVLLSLALIAAPPTALADDGSARPPETYFLGEVSEILEEGQQEIGPGRTNPFQVVRIRTNGQPGEPPELTIDHGKAITITEGNRVSRGQSVVVMKTTDPGGDARYFIIDHFRIQTFGFVAVALFFLVLAVCGLRGIGSLAGLLVSLAVIVFFIAPRILAGSDPLLTTILGASVIMTVSIYLAHGINRQTTIALAATMAVLALTGALAVFFVGVTHLSGLGSDEAYSLMNARAGALSTSGLLLSGIIIGTLGVLDDVTTSQTAAIFELFKVNPGLTFTDLVRSGLNIGREHILALVNTLALAYAGAGLPVFLLVTLATERQPLWVVLNSESIIEELVRTIAGSFGLVLAVPVTTLLAAWLVTRGKVVVAPQPEVVV